ncbi:uncharacterized protein J3D65DRAFT_607481 [Phyllosticta citribraziliensis]|uniref:Uncharacterized protein n=1 Tax=Phyllosticta citribraziliensis TaxID=989973 RepID=A0ABR1L512_9PEZI
MNTSVAEEVCLPFWDIERWVVGAHTDAHFIEFSRLVFLDVHFMLRALVLRTRRQMRDPAGQPTGHHADHTEWVSRETRSPGNTQGVSPHSTPTVLLPPKRRAESSGHLPHNIKPISPSTDQTLILAAHAYPNTAMICHLPTPAHPFDTAACCSQSKPARLQRHRSRTTAPKKTVCLSSTSSSGHVRLADKLPSRTHRELRLRLRFRLPPLPPAVLAWRVAAAACALRQKENSDKVCLFSYSEPAPAPQPPPPCARVWRNVSASSARTGSGTLDTTIRNLPRHDTSDAATWTRTETDFSRSVSVSPSIHLSVSLPALPAKQAPLPHLAVLSPSTLGPWLRIAEQTETRGKRTEPRSATPWYHSSFTVMLV